MPHHQQHGQTRHATEPSGGIVLTDKRSKKCAQQALENNLRSRFFPKLTVRVVDYSTDEGKELFESLNLKKLPVWLFDSKVKQAEKYDDIKRWLCQRGEYLELVEPVYYDPTRL